MTNTSIINIKTPLGSPTKRHEARQGDGGRRTMKQTATSQRLGGFSSVFSSPLHHLTAVILRGGRILNHLHHVLLLVFLLLSSSSSS